MSDDTLLALLPKKISSKVKSIEPLSGLTNQSFKLITNKYSYALRINANHTESFKIDRKRELKILENAIKAGISPEIIFKDSRNSILVTLFIDQEPWVEQDLQDKEKLKLLAQLFRKIHTLPKSGSPFEPEVIATNYFSNIQSIPRYVEFGKKCVSFIKQYGSIEVYCCCHNDVVVSNIIGFEPLFIIDWEYASDNNPMFDIASLSCFHGLNNSLEQTILNEYFDGHSKQQYEEFLLQKRLYNAIYWLWLASRHVMSPDDKQNKLLLDIESRLGFK
ncbi:MAG: phosphotransferase family protein [Woeseiaceae bacterium]|nr:phosphotransferase family protein [Woeseiaceae bacterium]MDG1865372.1 phosphotransferase family protein [Woeseiaceae bacterium]